MAKFDVKTAYRNIAVHPDDRVYSSVEDPWPILAVERVVHQTPTGVTNRPSKPRSSGTWKALGGEIV